MKYIFEMVTSPITDDWGFRPLTNKDFDPGRGLQVAHDIFEHTFPHDSGEINYEIMAFGAALYCRPIDEMYRGSSIGEVFGRSLPDICDSFWNDNIGRSPMFIDWDFKTRPLADSGAEQRHIPDFVRAIHKTITENEYEHEYSEGWLLHLNQFKHWIRHGYRFAKRRFPDQCRTNYAFTAIIEEVDRQYNLRHGESGQLIVSLDHRMPDLFRVYTEEPELSYY